MQQSKDKGALILVCQSSQLENFAWFSKQLETALTQKLNDAVTVKQVRTTEELINALQAPPTTHDVSEVHIFAEFQSKALVVDGSSNELLRLRRPIKLDPAAGQTIGTKYLPNTPCRIWFWSEQEQPDMAVLKILSRAFDQHFFLMPVNQLKSRLTGERSSRRKRKPENRTKVDRRPATQMLSLGKLAGYILLCGYGASLLFDTRIDFEIDEEHDRVITHSDVHSTDPSVIGEGEYVNYTWVHKRIKWDYEWFLARQWLEQADEELNAAAQYDYSSGYWPQVYRHILKDNTGRLDSIAKSLKRDANILGYDDYELATLVLSFVQHIPYKIPRNHLEILTPPMSVYNRYGDCDTKSVLYVLLMQKLGFKTAIFLSMSYRHAMAGIAVPNVGLFKSHGGTQYFFAETTYPGHRIGSIPQGMGNMFKWKLVPLDQFNRRSL